MRSRIGPWGADIVWRRATVKLERIGRCLQLVIHLSVQGRTRPQAAPDSWGRALGMRLGGLQVSNFFAGGLSPSNAMAIALLSSHLPGSAARGGGPQSKLAHLGRSFAEILQRD